MSKAPHQIAKKYGPDAGFRVSDDFFAQQQEQLMHTIALLNEAEQGLSIAGVPKKAYFTQPEPAAELLTQRIKEAVVGQKNGLTLPELILKPAFALSFVLLMLAGGWYYWDKQRTDKIEWTQVNELDINQLAEFVVAQRFFDLASVLSDQQDGDAILAFAYELPEINDEQWEEYLELEYQNLEINDYEE